MRFAVVRLAAVFAFCAVAIRVAGAVGSLDDLLAHVRAASGAPYSVHVRSEIQAGTGDEAQTFTVDSEGYRSLVRRCREGVCDGTYFDGDYTYSVNMNDTALPSSLHRNDAERVLRAVATSAFAAPDFASAGGAVTEITPAQQNGKTYRRLAVRVGGATLDVLIDPATWLPVEARAPDGSTAFSLLDYRKVGPVTIPFEIKRDGALLERYTSREIVAEPLRAPSGLDATFAANAAPLRMLRVGDANLNQPVIPCSVRGVPVNCLIDTGNSSLGISLELTERLGLDVSGEYEVSGLGHYITGVVTAGPLKVGGATLTSARYVVLHDLHDYGYDVVLGADLLAKVRATLDYGAGTISIGDPSLGTPPDIPLSFIGLLPVVDVQLGAQDVPLAIDTGDVNSINLSYDFYEANPALFEVRGERTVAGIGGSAEQVTGTIGSVRIATVEALQQPVAATRTDEPAGSGHLGAAFLGHFVVTLDYPHARFGLVPRPNDSAVHTTQ